MTYPSSIALRLGLFGLLWLAGGPGCTTGPDSVAAPPPADTAPPSGGPLECPQPRQTELAPDTYLSLTNPLPKSEYYIARGRMLYEAERKPASCAACHGSAGKGGQAGAALVPPPRNFACAETMNALGDGQLYWVIAHGSGKFHAPARQGAQQIGVPGRRAHATSAIPFYDQLSETEIWLLVTYIRTLTEQ